MSNINYYCKVEVEHSLYKPGVYLFYVDKLHGMWGKERRLLDVSNYAWKETENGVFWVKRNSSNLPAKLTDEEMKEFVWTKLQATEF